MAAVRYLLEPLHGLLSLKDQKTLYKLLPEMLLDSAEGRQEFSWTLLILSSESTLGTSKLHTHIKHPNPT